MASMDDLGDEIGLIEDVKFLRMSERRRGVQNDRYGEGKDKIWRFFYYICLEPFYSDRTHLRT